MERSAMILGYLIIGALIGMIAAAISLFLGASFILALGIYSTFGGFGAIFLTACHLTGRKIKELVVERRTRVERFDKRDPLWR